MTTCGVLRGAINVVIKDVKGIYELKVDTTRNIVYEKVVGVLTDDDIRRLHKYYVEKILP